MRSLSLVFFFNRAAPIEHTSSREYPGAVLMFIRRFSVALAFLAAGALAGCAGQPYNPALFVAQFDRPYQLASGDRVRVIVFGQDTLSNSFSVDPAGNISMPLIGLVKAYGLTTADLEGEIAARLRNGYVRDPRVSVEVEAFRPLFRASARS